MRAAEWRSVAWNARLELMIDITPLTIEAGLLLLKELGIADDLLEADRL